MPVDDSKESLENKLSQVHIPEPEEFVRRAAGISQVYGVLFADDIAIYYAPLNNEKEVESFYKVKEIKEGFQKVNLLALLVAKGDVFYQNAKYEVCSLFGNFKSKKRYCNAQSIIDFGGRILDAGVDGLFETLTDKALITKDELSENNYESISSICSFQNRLYALVRTKKMHNHDVAELNENNGKYSIRDKIISYNTGHIFLCQALILPEIPSTISGKQHDFSIMSCTELHSLDLNGKKIEGIKEKAIHRFALLNSNSEKATVVYSSIPTSEGIKLGEIDLKTKTAETEMLFSTANIVLALEVVRDRQLHERLISVGKELKIS